MGSLTANLFKVFNINKVTINANNNGAGGFTLLHPTMNILTIHKYLLANMIVAMGGRAAEVIFYNKTSDILQFIKKKNYFLILKT